ncbi:hypothetical protein L208DRAFT_1215375, partial [Tricholoma matsutake]
MPYCQICRDLKLSAINLYECELIPLYDSLDCVGFSRRTFFCILAQWRQTGDGVKHTYGLCGHPRLLVFDDLQYLLHLVRHRPDWFLDELVDLLWENRFISAHFVTILRKLDRAGYSVKKLKRIAAEQSKEKRSTFVYCMGQYTPDQFGFLDETSKDEKTPGQRQGRAKKGERDKRRQ